MALDKIHKNLVERIELESTMKLESTLKYVQSLYFNKVGALPEEEVHNLLYYSRNILKDEIKAELKRREDDPNMYRLKMNAIRDKKNKSSRWSRSDREFYEGDFGGLEGEEADIARWNCD